MGEVVELFIKKLLTPEREFIMRSCLWMICLLIMASFIVSCNSSDFVNNPDGDKDIDANEEPSEHDQDSDGDIEDAELDDDLDETDAEQPELVDNVEDETDEDSSDGYENDEEQYSGDGDEEIDDENDMEEDINLCEVDNICIHQNRLCVVEGGNAVCGDCIEGFHEAGNDCAENEECYEEACGIFGVCEIMEEEISCTCDTGYSGDRCEDCDRAAGYRWLEEKTECTYQPCPEFPCGEETNQYCTMYGECICQSGSHWSSDGITCTEDLCDPNPCLDVEYSTGICFHYKSNGNRVCECETNYLWDDDNNLCVLDCDNQCDTQGEQRCSFGEVRLCEIKNEDCAHWVQQDDCPSGVCRNGEKCVVCDNECPGIDQVCNGDTLEICERDEWGCRIYREEICELGCEEDACNAELCGSGEIEENEYCDSDIISCSSICADYTSGEAVCNDTCNAYDTSTCVQPAVVSSFVPISSGTFEMGNMYYPREDEHDVTLTRDFEMQNIKITQQAFEELMGYNPSYFPECGANCPVENITYFDTIHYANKLSVQDGLTPCVTFSNVVCDDGSSVNDETECLSKGGIRNAVISLSGDNSIYNCEGYRLPTEAEWEYAAKGGLEGKYFYNGNVVSYDELDTFTLIDSLDQISWYGANSMVDFNGHTFCAEALGIPDISCGTHPVGLKEPNGYCLYDMTGIILEWTYDLFIYWNNYPQVDPVSDPANIVFSEDGSNPYIAIRGCGWASENTHCRVTSRNAILPPTFKVPNIGFRLVRTLGVEK